VEGMTQEQRRNCLDTFYRRREATFLRGLGSVTPLGGVKGERGSDAGDPGVKGEYDTKPIMTEELKRELSSGRDDWEVKKKDEAKDEDGKLGGDWRSAPVWKPTEPPIKTEVKAEPVGKGMAVFLSDGEDDDEEL
jgi:hypothetical protein